jgi:hypothetical protein
MPGVRNNSDEKRDYFKLTQYRDCERFDLNPDHGEN